MLGVLTMEPTAEDLTPIFHSEISSSYLLCQYLDRGVNVRRFLALVHELNPDFIDPAGYEKKENIKREYAYKGKGTVDLRIVLEHPSRRKVVVLVEVKVHDFRSTTRDQIRTYLKAAEEENNPPGSDVFIVYLSQFTKRNLVGVAAASEPRTITEFEGAKRDCQSKVAHLAWTDFYRLLDEPGEPMPETDVLAYLLSLQRRWMEPKCKADLKLAEAGKQPRFFDVFYFPNTRSRLDELTSLGEVENDGKILRIELEKLDLASLLKLEEIIRYYGNSPDLRIKNKRTATNTLNIAKGFLQELADTSTTWTILGFYSRVFALAHEHAALDFSGVNNLSIGFWPYAQSPDRISLCTLFLKSREVTFQLFR
jgi:hypothetical protein